MLVCVCVCVRVCVGVYFCLLKYTFHIWGSVRQKQISRMGSNDYIPQKLRNAPAPAPATFFICRWRRYSQGKPDYFQTMVLFEPCYLKGASILSVLFCGFCHIITKEDFIRNDDLTSAVDKVTLVCHKIARRSAVELAVVCVRQDSCMAINTTKDWDGFGMICSCPDGPGSSWPKFTKTLATTSHLRHDTSVTIPGKSLKIRFIRKID